MAQILLVEDDESLGTTLKERLEREGYQVQWARTKLDASQLCGSTNEQGANLFDLIILDVGLPDGSGLDLARDIRMRCNAPLMFLSAMSSAEYRLEGFEIGAEDFMPKPFHLKELLLRVRRILERSGQGNQLRAGKFIIDADRRAVIFPDGTLGHPTGRDFEVLKFLRLAAPRAVSREELLAALWVGEPSQSGRTVDNSILRLRHLFRTWNVDPIRSVRGVGYQWVGED